MQLLRATRVASTRGHSTGLAPRSAKLKEMLQSNNIRFLMEAHSGLSARIVEETGFEGIWASGLSISAVKGARDNNELSYTQVLDVLEEMSDASNLPILVDADTGYGNFNNARRLVEKLEMRRIAGCCIEDKLFPKTNSLLDERSAQPLADPEEFALKIRAMKDTQKDPNFCVVARVEAFIAGWGKEEALSRARRYADAGADAVLIHSKKKTPADIEAFMAEWDGRAPVVIVPTAYPDTPSSDFEKLGISTIIWANHNLRASVTAMQEASRAIFDAQSIKPVEGKVVTVKEVFRLQDQKEYLDAEERYLPKVQ